MQEHRKLAAIMFTDIVGYSVQMYQNEEVALRILSKNRELHKKTIQRFNGEFIKEIGDGILAIFQSSWDAVCCAMELQHELKNASDFQLYIGIHQGDVVFSENDVFGNGVNIASRIQALCEPGGILISESVYNDIRNKAEIKASCLGEKELKNIDSPVRIYSISYDCINNWKAGIPKPDKHVTEPLKLSRRKHWTRSSTKIATITIVLAMVILVAIFAVRPYFLTALPDSDRFPIVVISFENLTGDSSFNYLQKAIPNLLITNLEQSRLLQVMSWERMQDIMKQLGHDDVNMISPDLGFEICKKEGCKFIVIGSFVSAGNIFATDAKVLDVETKKIISSVNARGNNVGSILRTQIDALSKDISRSIGISARKIESAHMSIMEVTTTSLDAYNYFLKGRDAYDKYYWDEAMQNFEQAIKIDPGFAMAILYLSKTFSQLGDMRHRDEMLEKAYRASDRATENEQLYIRAAYAGIIRNDPKMQLSVLLELSQKAPRDKSVFFALGHWYMQNDFLEKSISEFKKVLELDPFNAETYNQLAYLYFKIGEIDTSIEYLKKYSSLNPEDANPFDSMGDLYWIMGELDKAIEQFGIALEIKSQNWYSAAKIAYINAMKEDYQQVNQWMTTTLESASSESLKADIYWIIAFIDYLYGRLDNALQSLSKSEAIAMKYTNDFLYMESYFLKAFIYYDLEEYEKAQDQFNSFFALALPNPATDSADDWSAYYFFKGLVSIKLNQLDSAKNYLELLLPVSKSPEQEFRFNYLMREVQIASARQPGDLDDIPGKIDRDIPMFVSPGVLTYNLPYSRNSLAEAYHRFGLYDKAIAEYEKQIVFDPSGKDRRLVNPRYHYCLGIIYQEKGMKDKAINQFRIFLHLWQDADPILKEKEDAGKRLSQLFE